MNTNNRLNIFNTGPSANTSVHQKLKLVARQNRRLRELLRLEFVPDMPPKDFCLLNVAQITGIINERKSDKTGTRDSSLEGKQI